MTLPGGLTMNWTPEDHHDYSSQHQQKAEKTRLAQLALCDAEPTNDTLRRRLELQAA